MEKKNIKRLIEAALFTSPGVVRMHDLAKIANSNVAEVRVVVNSLMHDYESKATALEIRSESEGARMAVKEEYEDDVEMFDRVFELFDRHERQIKMLIQDDVGVLKKKRQDILTKIQSQMKTTKIDDYDDLPF